VTRQDPGSEVRIEWREPEGAVRAASLKVRASRGPEALAFPVSFVERTVRAGVIESFGLGAKRTLVVSKQIFLTLKSLLRRDVSAKNLAGPVGIVHQFTVVLEHGKLSVLIYWLAIISVNLGLFNLLPFPILDGGHILFLAIEKIKGSPVDIRVQEWATNIAFLLIMFLALFVTFNDIKRALG
jgi:regulator of sigma E protease